MNKFAAVLLALTISTPALALDVARTVDVSFLLDTGAGRCSATKITQDVLLTAAHCTLDQYKIVEKKTYDADGKEKTEKVRIATPGEAVQIFTTKGVKTMERRFVYKVRAVDPNHDLALVTIPPTFTASATFGCAAPKLADHVWAVGTSYGVLYNTVTEGVVSSLDRSYRDLGLAGDLGDASDTGESGLTQFSAPIAPGNSGGGLFNDNSELIGVTVRGGPGGFSFAVPQEDVQKFLNDNAIKVCQ